MSERRSRRRRDLWLPGLVGLIGVLLALAFWGLLVADRRGLLLEATRESAADTREAMTLGLQAQIEALRSLRDLRDTLGPHPEGDWKAVADRQVDQMPGLGSVAWVDADRGEIALSAGEQASPAGIALDLAQARSHLDHPCLLGPDRETTGEAGYRVFLPAGQSDGHGAGVLVAHFHVEPLLEEVLRARARGHALSVYWGDTEIFSRGSPAADRWQQWWRVEDVVELPWGGHWRVVHRPTAAFAAARLNPLPHYLLAVGIALAIVLALAAHQLRVIVRQSRFLAATNRALEQRGQELESKVAERTEALEDAMSEQEAFNYSVSHDLRSPLSAILNLSAILEEDYRGRSIDAEGAALLSRIRRSAQRAISLLEDLLQLSRAGRAALSFEQVDMNALARESFAQVRAAEDDRDVELFVDPLPQAVGDRSLLRDVFENLLSNSLKYSRGCEKRQIKVSGRSDAQECIYEVADNGQGFDMRFVDKLFVLFERLHSAEDIEGTGVGLAMVARIVKRHGGRVWAEGRPGEGARFSFAIPRREAP